MAKSKSRIRSVTVDHAGHVPGWSRYGVLVCNLANPRTPVQAFASKDAAERWGKAIARLIPPDRADGGTGAPQWWVLVVAFDHGRYVTGTRYVQRHWHCYRSFDPGAVMAKDHPILAGYGVTEGCS